MSRTSQWSWFARRAPRVYNGAALTWERVHMKLDLKALACRIVRFIKGRRGR